MRVATKFVVICYSSYRKVIYEAPGFDSWTLRNCINMPDVCACQYLSGGEDASSHKILKDIKDLFYLPRVSIPRPHPTEKAMRKKKKAINIRKEKKCRRRTRWQRSRLTWNTSLSTDTSGIHLQAQKCMQSTSWEQTGAPEQRKRIHKTTQNSVGGRN